MPELDGAYLTFEWVMLALRIAFIALIYFFLYQVAQVAIRELITIGRAEPPKPHAPSRAAPASVIIWEPASSSMVRGARFPISTYTTVGRSPENALILDDSYTSGNHAELVREADGWSVRDLASTNGTYVNDLQVYGQSQLENGDTIRFGNVEVEFHV